MRIIGFGIPSLSWLVRTKHAFGLFWLKILPKEKLNAIQVLAYIHIFLFAIKPLIT